MVLFPHADVVDACRIDVDPLAPYRRLDRCITDIPPYLETVAVTRNRTACDDVKRLLPPTATTSRLRSSKIEIRRGSKQGDHCRRTFETPQANAEGDW